MEKAIKLLRAYANWIGKTSAERELINTIKIAIEYLEVAQRRLQENIRE